MRFVIFVILAGHFLTAAAGFASTLTTSSKFASITKRTQPLLFSTVVSDKASIKDGTVDNPTINNKIPSSRGECQPILETNIIPEAINAKDPLVNELNVLRCRAASCPALWEELANLCPDNRAIYDEHLCDEPVELTFKQMHDSVQRCAAAFHRLGIGKGDNVAVFGENSAKWLIVDQGIQLAGAASVVRGAEAPLEEMRYIYSDSHSANVIVLQGPKLLKKLAADAVENGVDDGLGLESVVTGKPKTVILMHREKTIEDDIRRLSSKLGLHIFFLDEIILANPPISSFELPTLDRSDLATLVYTSGTTGRPKGVMLTHGNLLHQVRLRFNPNKKFEETEPLPGDSMLCLLPSWHITERTAELCALTRGCSLVYTNIKHLKSDLSEHKPECMVLVPRVLEKIHDGINEKLSAKSPAVKKMVRFFTRVGEMKNKHKKIAAGLVVGDRKPSKLQRMRSRSIVAALAPVNKLGDKLVWSKVRALFGGKQKIVFSGGSSLPGALEQFYELCKLNILVGYGLTECSPVITHRFGDANLVAGGCVGKPIAATEVRVVDPETSANDCERPPLKDGDTGLVLVRGPQVMKGYYNNIKATNKAIDRWGWFDTGDLGQINPATGDLFIIGREKDTIVLINGENVEPIPIEDAILEHSKLIEQVMLLGQEEKSLTAVAILNPTALAESGYLDAAQGELLQTASDQVNSPQCTEELCLKSTEELILAAYKLRENRDLQNALRADIKKACADFRPWEQVSNIYISLEPFAMANGLLTQSFKVKRDKVKERYLGTLIDEGLMKGSMLKT